MLGVDAAAVELEKGRRELAALRSDLGRGDLGSAPRDRDAKLRSSGAAVSQVDSGAVGSFVSSGLGF